MKVVCVNNGFIVTGTESVKLTVGVAYEVLSLDHDGSYGIVNDLGDIHYYNPKRFLSIEDMREDKLNKLGIWMLFV